MSMDKQMCAEYEARIKELNNIYAAERAKFKEDKVKSERIVEDKKA